MTRKTIVYFLLSLIIWLPVYGQENHNEVEIAFNAIPIHAKKGKLHLKVRFTTIINPSDSLKISFFFKYMDKNGKIEKEPVGKIIVNKKIKEYGKRTKIKKEFTIPYDRGMKKGNLVAEYILKTENEVKIGNIDTVEIWMN